MSSQVGTPGHSADGGAYGDAAGPRRDPGTTATDATTQSLAPTDGASGESPDPSIPGEPPSTDPSGGAGGEPQDFGDTAGSRDFGDTAAAKDLGGTAVSYGIGSPGGAAGEPRDLGNTGEPRDFGDAAEPRDCVGSDPRRVRAAEVAATVAARLRDPASVASVVAASFDENGLAPHQRWEPGTLATGHPGISLLHAELSAVAGEGSAGWGPVGGELLGEDSLGEGSVGGDSVGGDRSGGRLAGWYLAAARAHLTPYTRPPTPPPPIGLARGLAGVGAAIAALSARLPEFGDWLPAIDVPIQGAVADLVYDERDRLALGLPGSGFERYDVVDGLAGIGGYLLARRPAGQRAVRMALRALTALTEDVIVDGEPMPGWYLARRPGGRPGDTGSVEEPHFTIGLAYGIAGPLALLSIARASGVRVPGDDRAIRRVVGWLLAERRLDVEGIYWPYALAADPAGERAFPVGRGVNGWCGGTLGVTRAVQLAAVALDEPEWARVAASGAVSAIRVALAADRRTSDRPVSDRRTSDRPASVRSVSDRRTGQGGGVSGSGAVGTAADDSSLCHGWAGLLQLAWRMRRTDPDGVPAASVDALADRLLAGFDSSLPFGFRCTPHGWPAADRAGLLDGAAGVALALATYASDRAPATNWDRALVIA